MAHESVEILRRPLDELPNPLPIPTLRSVGVERFDATIRPPGSKSLTNRAVLLAALASGRSELLHPLLEADDAKRMLAAVEVLGAKVEVRDGAVAIEGVGGRWGASDGATLFLNNAGTATRFLAASSVLASDPMTIDGNERMRQRPIGPLVEALAQVGVSGSYAMTPGHPPVVLTPPDVRPDGATLVLGELPSSQFVSGLMLAGLWLPGELTIRIEGTVTSRSYIDMTLGLIRNLGGHAEASGDRREIRVGDGSGLPGFDLSVEPDASGATYWWSAAALCAGSVVRVPGLLDSLQGDAEFPKALAPMGVGVETIGGKSVVGGPRSLAATHADMSDMPDAAMSLAAVACFAKGTTTMAGLETLRVKECDRIEAMETELAKVGMGVASRVGGDEGRMAFTPPSDAGIDCSADVPVVEFDTYDDHRMAMSLALIGLRRPGVLIRDPKCVAKTYPTFFQDLAKLYE